MNFLFLKKLQLIRLLPNRIEHLKRAKELCFPLAILLGFDVFTIQPNFFGGGVTPKFNPLIVSSFLKLLGMVEILVIYDH